MLIVDEFARAWEHLLETYSLQDNEFMKGLTQREKCGQSLGLRIHFVRGWQALRGQKVLIVL